jgi:hypothetical protein
VDDGSKLALDWKGGKRWLAVDTGTWRITHPSTSSFPWTWVAGATVAALVVLATVLLLGRRRFGGTHKEALPQPL